MTSSPRRTASRRRRHPAHAFTLIELLVVIGIIVLLAAILVPVVSQVRMQGYKATTEGEMQRIMTACQNYYHDWNAYPGPLANNQVVGNPSGTGQQVGMQPAPNANVTLDTANITSSENLVLGLLGLLSPTNSAADPKIPYAPPPPTHDVLSLNYNRPASYHYIDYIPEELTSGYAYAQLRGPGGPPISYPTDVQSNGGTNVTQSELISDTVIPEFQDHIPDPMPILYMKTYVGVPTPPSGQSPGAGIVTNDESQAVAQYNFSQLAPYGFLHVSSIDYAFPSNMTPPSQGGVNREVVAYFMNPNIAGQPRGKDTFILISAGPDRLYGTKDDIIVTP